MKQIPINTTEKSSEVNFSELSKKMFIDVTKKIERPPIALGKGEYYYTGKAFSIPLCTYGNFSAIAGPSKSMKTFLKTALIAGYIGGKSNNYFEDLKGFDTEKKYIIDLDTEQSEYHVSLSAKRVVKMVGVNSPFYIPFQLRALDPKERFEFVEWIFMESEWRSNLGFVAIDGIADLINNTNDLEQSTRTTNALLKWSAESGAHITTVIHHNFDSNKATGHVGSSITKKAETILKVARNEHTDVVEVVPQYTRNIPFEKFSFSLDNNFLPKQEKNGF